MKNIKAIVAALLAVVMPSAFGRHDRTLTPRHRLRASVLCLGPQARRAPR